MSPIARELANQLMNLRTRRFSLWKEIDRIRSTLLELKARDRDQEEYEKFLVEQLTKLGMTENGNKLIHSMSRIAKEDSDFRGLSSFDGIIK